MVLGVLWWFEFWVWLVVFGVGARQDFGGICHFGRGFLTDIELSGFGNFGVF